MTGLIQQATLEEPMAGTRDGRPGGMLSPLRIAPGMRMVCLLFLLLDARGLQASEMFQLSDYDLIIPERGRVLGCSLQTDDQRLIFIPPERWKATVNPQTNEVLFVSPDLRVSFSLQILPPQPDQSDSDLAGSWRAQVQALHPQGRPVEEFDCYIGGSKGSGFDMETTAGGLPIRTRTCVASLPHATFLFNLRAPSDVFPKYHLAFASMMGSLQWEIFKKPAQASVQKPVEKTLQKPVQTPVQKPVQKPVQQPAQAPVQKPVPKPVQEPVQP